jgi:hypothetical protein
MVNGKLHKTKVIIPITISVEGEPSAMNIRPDKPNKGVFVFKYEGSLVLQFPMIFDQPIPPGRIPQAEKIFRYRQKFDHMSQFKKDTDGK